MKPHWLLVLLIALPVSLFGQQANIKGLILGDEGEKLYAANLIILPDSILASTDADGSFSARVTPGPKTFRISYAGYETLTSTPDIRQDSSMSFVLQPKVHELKQVVVQASRFSNADIFESSALGTQTLTPGDFIHLPALMGESDVLKAARLLPGSASGVEGSADMFVRGGAADQNLILLDGAPLYNASHLLGFLSVFNPEVLEKADVIHGGFSAEYGGRLSSIVDVSTLSGIAEKTTASANIGLISSSFKLEQPISKDKLGFWVAGRTSYVDKVSQLSSASDFPYSFQELNGKVIFSPSKSDKMELSHYSAIDYLDIMRDVDGDGRGMKTTYHSNNSLETFKWGHSIGRRWKSEASAFHTRFAYNTANAFKEEYAVSGQSDIEDIGARLSLHRDSLWTDIALSAGIEWMRHDISPKIINPHGSVSDLVEPAPPDDKIVHEIAAYVQQEWSILPRLTISAGLRTSMAITPTKKYILPEPRLSLRFALPKEQVLKLSYSRMVQYLHRISNSAMSTPIDVWLPVNETFGPQTSRQVSMAWQRFSSERKIFFSAEGFYKSMDNLLAYKLGTNFLFKSDFNSMLVKGDGKAYGLEFLVRKESGRFTGWISYTLSWSWRRYDGMNDGKWFHARYDRRHNGAVVGQYRLGNRWIASMIWEYISGARFTPAVGQYLATAPGGDGLVLVPEYAPLNSVKLSDAHRLDVSFRYFSRPGSKFKWNLFGGVYNAYNRATPFGIVIRDDPDKNTTRYVQPALFGLIPFVGYGCQI